MGVNHFSQGHFGLTLDGSAVTLAVARAEHMKRLSFVTVRNIIMVQTGTQKETEASC